MVEKTWTMMIDVYDQNVCDPWKCHWCEIIGSDS